MSSLQKGKSHYITGLDGLRALALIAVIAYHLDISGIPGGFLGVDIFFVLSGFLVTDLIIARRKSEHRLDLANFWVRRFKRLLPALIFMLIILVAWVTLLDRSLLPSLRGDVLATAVYGNNWWLIFHQVSYFERFSNPAPLVHLWSLSVEGQFYIVWPLLLALGLRFTPKRIQMVGITWLLILASVLTMALMYQPGFDPSRVYYGTDTRVFALLIGASLAMLVPSHTFVSNHNVRTRWIFEGIGWLGLATILYLFIHMNEFDDFVYHGGLVIAAVAAAMVVASLLHPTTQISKLMSWKPLRWIGVRSYGIYLWHYPIIELTKPAVNTDGYNWTLAIMQVSASVLLAAFSYKYIEEPIRRGAITKGWKQIYERKWTWNQLSLKHWMISTCAIAILIVSSVGMITRIPVTAATSEPIITDPSLTQ
jgi:peptidoglycan/LPS O-acetylase OafA/YrhL